MTDAQREALAVALRDLGYIDVERTSPFEWWVETVEQFEKACAAVGMTIVPAE